MKISAIDQDALTVLQGRELYGLEVLEQLNINRPIKLTYGSIYPVLNRLSKRSLIEFRWGDEASAGARRKYYKLTDFGEEKLQQVQQYRKQLAERGC